ncbi:MAG: fusA, partial [Gammaproteobacteria bacterium]|nr:fusA [Gammaproteobacteria bacterium]
GAIPRQYLPAVEKGVRQVLAEGAIAGYPLQDLQVEVYDGKYHPVDSKEVAFVSAGRKAFLDAIQKAKPVVLEPIVEIAITAPNNATGDIAADLSGRRGRISNTITLTGGVTTTTGLVPLSELVSYQSQLKSMTGGTGSYSISLSHYDPVPAKTQKELMAAFKPAAEE